MLKHEVPCLHAVYGTSAKKINSKLTDDTHRATVNYFPPYF